MSDDNLDFFDKELTVADKIWSSISVRRLFDKEASTEIEEKIDEVCRNGEKGIYKPCTVDRAPLRNKYFFGEGYIYGNQLKQRGAGNEKLFPKGEVDQIPQWIFDLVVEPVVKAGIIPQGFVNSAVINDYQPGGCIVSHVDPPQIFDRPIVTVSFMSDSALSFGCRFTFRPMNCSPPVVSVPIKRGCVLSMGGFAANDITHCIRPEDVTERRSVIILRHVPSKAPRLSKQEMEELQASGVLPISSLPNSRRLNQSKARAERSETRKSASSRSRTPSRSSKKRKKRKSSSSASRSRDQSRHTKKSSRHSSTSSSEDRKKARSSESNLESSNHKNTESKESESNRLDESPGQSSPLHIPNTYSDVLLELSKVENEIKSVAMSLSNNETFEKKTSKSRIEVKSKSLKSKNAEKKKRKNEEKKKSSHSSKSELSLKKSVATAKKTKMKNPPEKGDTSQDHSDKVESTLNTLHSTKVECTTLNTFCTAKDEDSKSKHDSRKKSKRKFKSNRKQKQIDPLLDDVSSEEETVKIRRVIVVDASNRIEMPGLRHLGHGHS